MVLIGPVELKWLVIISKVVLLGTGIFFTLANNSIPRGHIPIGNILFPTICLTSFFFLQWGI